MKINFWKYEVVGILIFCNWKKVVIYKDDQNSNLKRSIRKLNGKTSLFHLINRWWYWMSKTNLQNLDTWN